MLAEEEAEKAKERAAQIASDRLIEQQEVLAAKQYEQQRALICMQAEIGEKPIERSRLLAGRGTGLLPVSLVTGNVMT